MSAQILLFDGPATCAGAKADHRREDFIFPRTQSIAMRSAAWERRTPPIKSSPIRYLFGKVIDLATARAGI